MKSKYRARTYVENDSSVSVNGISGPYETMSAEDAETIRSLLARKYWEKNSWVAKHRRFYFPYARLRLWITKRLSEFSDRQDLVMNGKYSIEKGEVISCKRSLFRAVYRVKRGKFVYEIEDGIWSYSYNKKAGIKNGVPVYVVILGDDFGYELVKKEVRMADIGIAYKENWR